MGSFLYSWQQLGAKDKAEGLDAFGKKRKRGVATAPRPTSAVVDLRACPMKACDGVQLYSYYSNLKYYPTMHWYLDKTPETDDYWVGIYKREAENTEYIDYQWLGKTAQGSYCIGRLKTAAEGIESRERVEEFELRLFKGDYQRVEAVTNVLRGTIQDAPTEPDVEPRRALEIKQLDPGTREFIRAIQTFQSLDTPHEGTYLSTLQDLFKQWDAFTPLQKLLLFPALEQDTLPDKIKTKPDPKALDRPEPKICFPSLGKAEGLRKGQDPKVPQNIVLTITLNYSCTEIYPVVNVEQVVPPKRAWMGVYHTQR